MRDASPARVIVTGDPELASRYVGPARTQLGFLYNEMCAFKRTTGVRRMVYADGTVVTVQIIYGQRIIQIDAPEVVVAVVAEEPVIVSTKTELSDFGWVIRPYLTDTTDQAALIRSKGEDASGIAIFDYSTLLPIQPSFDDGDSFFVAGHEYFSEGFWDRNETDEIRLYSDYPAFVIVWSSRSDKGSYIVVNDADITNYSYLRLSIDGKRAILGSAGHRGGRVDRFDVDFSAKDDTGNIVATYVQKTLLDGSHTIDDTGELPLEFAYTRDQKQVLWQTNVTQSAGLLFPNDGQLTRYKFFSYVQDIDTGVITASTRLVGVSPPDHAVSSAFFFPAEPGSTWALVTIKTYADSYVPPASPVNATQITAQFKVCHNDIVVFDSGVASVSLSPGSGDFFRIQAHTISPMLVEMSEDGRTYALFYSSPNSYVGVRRAYLTVIRDTNVLTLELPLATADDFTLGKPPIVWNRVVFQEFADGSGGKLVSIDEDGNFTTADVIQEATVIAEEFYKLPDSLTWYGADNQPDFGTLGANIRMHALAQNEAGQWVHTADSPVLRPPLGAGDTAGFLESLNNTSLWTVL